MNASDVKISDSEVETLIRNTYDGRIDPHVDAEARLERYCYNRLQGGLCADQIATFSKQSPYFVFFDPEEEEHIALISHFISAERLEQIQGGDDLTQEEESRFEENAEQAAAEAGEIESVIGFVYRLETSEDSSEKRPVFFVAVEHPIYGKAENPIGPLTAKSLSDHVGWVPAEEWHFVGNPPRLTVEEFFQSLKAFSPLQME